MEENKCWLGNKLKNRKNYFYGSHVFMKKEYTNPGCILPKVIRDGIKS